MATRDETLTTDKSVDDALKAGTQTLESLGLKVKQNGSNELEAKKGGKFLIYWLGLFLSASRMPVRVRYTVTEKDGRRTIQMHTQSSVPLAFYVWKYKKRANTVADALKQGVAGQLA
jgi:hypothetical protein